MSNIQQFHLFAGSVFNVGALHDIGTGEHTGTGDTTEDISSGTLHERHEALVLDHLHTAVQTVLVLDGRTARHHHASSNGINWVRGQSRDDGDCPAEEEAGAGAAVSAQEHWLQSIVETKVETTVDEDTNARNDEATVEAANAVSGQSLLVDVEEAVELALAALALGVVGESGTRVVERVDEHEGERTGATTGGDVGGKLLGGGGVLWYFEGGLDRVLEGEIERLGWEVSEDVGQVTSPEWDDTLSLQDSHGAVDDTSVWLVESALLDHLILVLDEELDSLDWCSGGL